MREKTYKFRKNERNKGMENFGRFFSPMKNRKSQKFLMRKSESKFDLESKISQRSLKIEIYLSKTKSEG